MRQQWFAGSFMGAMAMVAGGTAAAQTAAPPADTAPMAASATEVEQASEATPTADLSGRAGDIIVTARRRDERLQDVPASIQAFDGDALRQLGARSLEDVLGLVPGIEIIGTTGIAGSNEIVVRGAGTGRAANADAAIGLYFNGAYIAGGNTGGRTYSASQLFDVERIEVLKGPQGALYGRNSLGAALNVISKRPSLTDSSGYIEAGVASKGEVSIEGAGTYNVIEDGLAVRVGGRYGDRKNGFYQNNFLGNNPDRFNTFLGRVSVRGNIADVADIVVQYDRSDTDRQGRLTADLDLQPDPFRLTRDDDNRGSQKLDNIGASAVIKLGFADLTLIANRRERTTLFTGDIDQFIATTVFDPTRQIACIPAVGGARPVPAPGNQRCTELQNDVFKQTTLEARIAGQIGVLRYIFGGDYLDGTDIFKVQEFGRGANAFLLETSNDIESKAVFGGIEATFDFGLSGGVDVRYTEDEKRSKSKATRTEGPMPGLVLYDNDFPFKASETLFATFARFEITPKHALYGRVGSGFRAGGLNVDGRDLVNPATGLVVVAPDSYGPEKAISYEAGIKTQWLSDHLIVNLSAFQTDFSDIIQNSDNGLTGLNRVAVLINSGDAAVRGIELEVQLAKLELLGGRFDISANGVYTESEVSGGNFNGRNVSRIPDYGVSAVVQYSARLNENLRFNTNLRYRQQWGGWQNPLNTLALPEPQTFDLTFGLDSKEWGARLTISNLTDEDEPIDLTAARVIVPRIPRAFQFSIIRRFGN